MSRMIQNKEIQEWVLHTPISSVIKKYMDYKQLVSAMIDPAQPQKRGEKKRRTYTPTTGNPNIPPPGSPIPDPPVFLAEAIPHNLGALRARLTPQMPIQCVRPCKILPAPITYMQLLVSFAIMLSCKPFTASGPTTLTSKNTTSEGGFLFTTLYRDIWPFVL
jgi:hypothetical protein